MILKVLTINFSQSIISKAKTSNSFIYKLNEVIQSISHVFISISDLYYNKQKKVQDQLLGTHLAKQNYVQIRYEPKRGLFMQWDFKDLYQTNNYYHHLLIVFQSQETLNVSLLEMYFKKMKLGDLLGIIYYNHNQGPKMVNWIQKTQSSKFPTVKFMNKIVKTPLKKFQTQKLFQLACKYTSENVFSNIISTFILEQDPIWKQQQLLSLIAQRRLQGAFPYLVTVFNNKWPNRILFNKGVHFFNIQSVQLSKIVFLCHSIINTAAIRFAKIVIQCSDAQLISYDTLNWENPQFNRLQRRFYGPSVTYDEDFIQFHVLDLMEDAEFNMQISLELHLFSGVVVTDKKKIKLCFKDEKHYDKSVNLTMPEPMVSVQGIDIRGNPFGTSTFVRLMRSPCQLDQQTNNSIEKSYRQNNRKDKPIQQIQIKPYKPRQKRKIQYFIPQKIYRQDDPQFYWFGP